MQQPNDNQQLQQQQQQQHPAAPPPTPGAVGPNTVPILSAPRTLPSPSAVSNSLANGDFGRDRTEAEGTCPTTASKDTLELLYPFVSDSSIHNEETNKAFADRVGAAYQRVKAAVNGLLSCSKTAAEVDDDDDNSLVEIVRIPYAQYMAQRAAAATAAAAADAAARAAARRNAANAGNQGGNGNDANDAIDANDADSGNDTNDADDGNQGDDDAGNDADDDTDDTDGDAGANRPIPRTVVPDTDHAMQQRRPMDEQQRRNIAELRRIIHERDPEYINALNRHTLARTRTPVEAIRAQIEARWAEERARSDAGRPDDCPCGTNCFCITNTAYGRPVQPYVPAGRLNRIAGMQYRIRFATGAAVPSTPSTPSSSGTSSSLSTPDEPVREPVLPHTSTLPSMDRVLAHAMAVNEAQVRQREHQRRLMRVALDEAVERQLRHNADEALQRADGFGVRFHIPRGDVDSDDE
ncbi:hypothetical protein sr12236 [Sporisorium reilianum SRZ2]|uniref:Uncharacterized protein n=1 Tax=Sporisorium reilianum (strain SRZ2) TaxID=999809 RepID=E6ZSY2_SPORE|nr:hypothetical protein sr12236 [Sporisorium reilianum SRZ2]